MPFNSIFGWFMKKRIHQIDLFQKYPHEVQQEVFESHIENGKKTVFGRQFNFQEIESYKDFNQSVPLQTYEEVLPFVERLLKGERDVLWPGETKWFAKSSGTTGRSKLIPVTKESLEDCHYKGGKDLLAMYYRNYPNPKLYKGKHLAVGGSAEINELSADSYFGDLSAIIVKNLPWWAEIKRTPGKDIALMGEWEEKLEKMAHSIIHEDICIIAGVPSWTMVLMERVMEITGERNLKNIWPNLELFMHGGVNFEPYREYFEKIIPDPRMNYLETYNASEGFFGMQDKIDSDELLLMLDYGVYYEFIPMSSYDGIQSKKVINLAEVKIGVNYAMVISTNGGLWRYIIGDTVEFTSVDPYRIKITGRTKSYLNTFGEELMVGNTDLAMAEICKLTNAQIKDYTVAPVYMTDDTKGAHEWFLEFEKMPDEPNRFCSLLDEKLRELNSDYDAKRYQDLVLLEPKFTVLEKGTFDLWLKSKGRLGGQNKVPRLNNSRTIIDEVIDISKLNRLELIKL